mgnify:CR=1 FL=1
MKCAIVTGKLGAGRTKAGEAINYNVGLTLTSHIGSKVETGERNELSIELPNKRMIKLYVIIT